MHRTLRLLTFVFVLGLAGCGGDRFSAATSDGTGEAVAPEAIASGPAMVSEHALFTLDGSASTFESGAVLSWEQRAGPPATIANPAAVMPTIAAPGVDVETELRFVLRIANPSGMTDETEVVLRVQRRQLATWTADVDAEGVFDLFVADLATGESVNLTATLPGTIHGYALSPLRSHVAFLATDPQSGQLELHTVRIDGSELTVRSGAAVPAGDVSWFAWSPDGDHLAFLADKRIDATYELYVVAADERAPHVVSGALVSGGDVLDAAWSPDGSRLLYRADAREVDAFELYTIGRDGADLRRVSGDVLGPGGLENSVASSRYAWAPDGQHIVYVASSDSFPDQLFSATPDGTTQLRISGDLAMDGAVLDFAWAPDGSQIAYRAREDDARTPELYVVGPDGSGHARVSVDLDSGEAVSSHAWAPDGSALAIVADPSLQTARELFVVDPEGTDAPRTVSYGEAEAANIVEGILWRPDGGAVLYLGDPMVAGERQVIASTTDGEVRGISIAPSPQPGAGARAPAWSPTDPNAVAYLAEQAGAGQVELYLGFLDASPGRRQSPDLPEGATVRGYLWHPEGTHLAYVADAETVGLLDVYVLPSTPEGTADVVRLSSSGSARTGILDLRIAP